MQEGDGTLLDKNTYPPSDIGRAVRERLRGVLYVHFERTLCLEGLDARGDRAVAEYMRLSESVQSICACRSRCSVYALVGVRAEYMRLSESVQCICACRSQCSVYALVGVSAEYMR